MLNITRQGVYYKNNAFVPVQDGPAAGLPAPEEAKKGTMEHSPQASAPNRRPRGTCRPA